MELPDPDELERLKLAPEVAHYLLTRGIPFPDCPPLIQTPEPDALFDAERVDRVLDVFSRLRHTQGQWAGKPLKPDPWQVAYILAPVFGWVRRDSDVSGYVRVINNLYIDVPRKNGKSSLAGGIALYLACADGEQGAQVVTAATTEHQAGFVFQPIKTLATKSPALKPHVKAMQKKVLHPATGSYIEVISSVADAQHGANMHGAIVDELHVHKTSEMVETIETGTGSRTQPLIVIITTADDGQVESAYARKRTRVEQLASGTITDSSTYGVVWAAEESDDPFVEETWRKANPGLGISPTRAYIRRAAAEAQSSPTELAKFLRLHLGIRANQDARFLQVPDWDRNASLVDERVLAGRVAYGGLDLASASDLTALCWLFPDDGGHWDALWRFWLPESAIHSLNRATAGAAEVWRRRGYLSVTPGNVTDYDWVRSAITRDSARFDVRELGFDPWNATQLTNDLAADEAPLVTVRQGYPSLSPALKEIKRLIRAGTEEDPLLRHGGNPVMRWMIGNLAVAEDPAGNVKPDKRRSMEKIDGVSALVTAMSRAMHHQPPKRSVYEDDDLAVI